MASAGRRAGWGVWGGEWARTMIAEHIASHDLERALSIWRELDPDDVGKPKALIVQHSNMHHPRPMLGKEVIEAEFEPEPKYQLYKIPVLLILPSISKGASQSKPRLSCRGRF